MSQATSLRGRVRRALGGLRLVRNRRDVIAHRRGRRGAVDYRLVNGLTIAAAVGDRGLLERIVETFGDHRFPLPVAEAQVILDMGAGSGLFTLYALHHSPDATVIAFEGRPGPRELLDRNLEANGFAERVQCRSELPSMGLAALVQAAGVERADIVRIDSGGDEIGLLNEAPVDLFGKTECLMFRSDDPAAVDACRRHGFRSVRQVNGVVYARRLWS